MKYLTIQTPMFDRESTMLLFPCSFFSKNLSDILSEFFICDCEFGLFPMIILAPGCYALSMLVFSVARLKCDRTVWLTFFHHQFPGRLSASDEPDYRVLR